MVRCQQVQTAVSVLTVFGCFTHPGLHRCVLVYTKHVQNIGGCDTHMHTHTTHTHTIANRKIAI